MIAPTHVDPRPPAPPPKNDAAPLAGGAGVKNWPLNPTSILLILTPPARRKAGPGTSGEASMPVPVSAATHRATVMTVTVQAGPFGATDTNIKLSTAMRTRSVSARSAQRRALGLVVDSGQRRPTHHGRPAAVWVAATRAMAGPAANGRRGSPKRGPTP